MYKRVKLLIDLLEEYEETNKDEFNETKFASWIISKNSKKKLFNSPDNIDGYIAMLIRFMGSYAHFYTKLLFKDSEIYSIEDYSLLITLVKNKQLSKMELMNLNLLEKSSGIEIIKRLLKYKLIIEVEGIKDKREKIISLTTKGKDLTMKFQKKLEKLSNHIVGDLSEEEKLKVLSILTRLNQYHKPYFENRNKKNILKTLNIN